MPGGRGQASPGIEAAWPWGWRPDGGGGLAKRQDGGSGRVLVASSHWPVRVRVEDGAPVPSLLCASAPKAPR